MAAILKIKDQDGSWQAIPAIVGPQGPEGQIGPAGPEGVTPQKGVDYFTEEDKSEFIKEVTSQISQLSVSIVSSVEEVTEEMVIYLILKETEAENNLYDEYMFISGKPELIGSTQVDLTDYYTKSEVDEKFASIVDGNEVQY